MTGSARDKLLDRGGEGRADAFHFVQPPLRDEGCGFLYKSLQDLGGPAVGLRFKWIFSLELKEKCDFFEYRGNLVLGHRIASPSEMKCTIFNFGDTRQCGCDLVASSS